MKSIEEFIDEEMGISTPLNTLGMGEVSLETDPVCLTKQNKRRKKKKAKKKIVKNFEIFIVNFYV